MVRVTTAQVRTGCRSGRVLHFYLLLDVGNVVMMRKCMLVIKRRAENVPDHSLLS